MKKSISLFIAIMTILVFAGCGDTTQSDAQVSVMGSEQTNSVENVTVSYASDLMKNADENFVILDVRTPEEYAEGHIANSVNVDYLSADFSVKMDDFDRSKTYLIYCRSGRRSAEAGAKMVHMGFENVINMLGGINDWKAADGEVSA